MLTWVMHFMVYFQELHAVSFRLNQKESIYQDKNLFILNGQVHLKKIKPHLLLKETEQNLRKIVLRSEKRVSVLILRLFRVWKFFPSSTKQNGRYHFGCETELLQANTIRYQILNRSPARISPRDCSYYMQAYNNIMC